MNGPFRDLRAWALIVAMIAAIPLVAFAANAQSAEEPPTATARSPPPPSPATPPPSEPMARASLTLETDRIELEPGMRGFVGYKVHNDGEAPVTVRVDMSGLGEDADAARTVARVRLDPGDVYRGRLPIQAPADGGFRLVRVEAAVEGERGMASLAFLHVSSPLRVLPMPAIDFRPMPMPTLITRCDIVPQPTRGDALLPCTSPRPTPVCEPRVVEGGEEILLQLALKGKIVDGKLVIDLDPALLAALGAEAVGRSEATAGLGTGGN